ncbi:5'-methylthioadenosine phosphorylase [Streptomyces sp. V4I8]|uniref:S-methyl-5'-thioadenosine phosphorylase n=1 Tax=Streptomyces sp. V4I8 TaxID=3156469 RepID=UPI003513DA82
MRTEQLKPAECTSRSFPDPGIGVIGGSGLYELFTDAWETDVDTPFGRPSDPLTIGAVADRTVAFLPRHGRDHRLAPHTINYRANLWALRSIGVRQVLAPCAVGSLREELRPGCMVVPDQIVDRTSGRIQTFYDSGAVHVPFADPYCARGRTAVLKSAAAAGIQAHDGGTMVVVEGPRFSSRAESRWFAASGWSLVNMTGHPEAALARELGLCYTTVALVTDRDAGIETGATVDQETVFKVFKENTERVKRVILGAVRLLPEERTCLCASVLDGLTLPFELP